MARACILGVMGQRLDADERAFLREARPFGVIVFGRNVSDSDQLRALCGDIREALDDAGAPIFVDQEGGRVQRLRPPVAPRRPALGRIGALYHRDGAAGLRASYLHHRLLADDLKSHGINADCAPCLDVLSADTHQIIGDRAFGDDTNAVAALGRAAVAGLHDGGVAAVIKHIPGHGRALVDSHETLPVVEARREDLERDFAPFRALADAGMAMTAHVTYSAFDAEACATISGPVIEQVIRRAIGFDGLLMSDDLSMKALGGSFAERTRRAIAAGCDVVLHGNGALVGEPARDLMAEMCAVAEAAPELEGEALRRAMRARDFMGEAAAFDRAGAEAEMADLGLGGIWASEGAGA